MSTPGAITSTHEPTLENDASRSVRSLAATVMADGARAGEDEQASALLLPAATATETPSAVRRAIAWSVAVLAAPPRLMFTTAGWPAWCWATTQSMPAITCELVPLPWQLSTRTATRRTPLATP